MKRLAVLAAGLGVILLVGCREESAAQSLALPEYDHSVDSVRTLTLEERAEKNLAYVKPGPAEPEKVAGELLVGWIGAAAFGYVGAREGWNLTYVEDKDESKGWFDLSPNLSGLSGAIPGYLILSNLGCAAGVSLVGNTGGEKGSYWASLGGSVAGTVIGGLCAIAIASATDYESWAPAIVLTAAQAGGATLGFNGSRKKVVESSSEALLNLNNNELSLTFPQMSACQDLSGSIYYRVNLLQANF